MSHLPELSWSPSGVAWTGTGVRARQKATPGLKQIGGMGFWFDAVFKLAKLSVSRAYSHTHTGTACSQDLPVAFCLSAGILAHFLGDACDGIGCRLGRSGQLEIFSAWAGASRSY